MISRFREEFSSALRRYRGLSASDYFEYGILGNRVAAASVTGMVVFSTGILDSLSHYQMNNQMGDSSLLAVLPPLLHSSLYLLSCLSFAIVSQGTTTAQTYRSICDHVERHGSLDEVVARRTITVNSDNRRFLGYCEQQGLYLAARDTGQLEVFERVRKEHSRCRLPHF